MTTKNLLATYDPHSQKFLINVQKKIIFFFLATNIISHFLGVNMKNIFRKPNNQTFSRFVATFFKVCVIKMNHI